MNDKHHDRSISIEDRSEELSDGIARDSDIIKEILDLRANEQKEVSNVDKKSFKDHIIQVERRSVEEKSQPDLNLVYNHSLIVSDFGPKKPGTEECPAIKN